MSDDRPWLAAYPRGVPADIDPDTYASLVALFEHSVERFADHPAFTNLGATLSYREADRLSRHFAAYLQSTGLAPGDRVALMLPNLLQYPVAAFAALRAGFVVVNVNPLYTPRELRHQLMDSGARVVIVLENYAATVQQALEGTAVEHVIVTRVGDHLPALKGWLTNFVVKYVRRMVPRWRIRAAVDYRQALQLGEARRFEPVEVQAEDLAFLQYTGGTTGVAKGAMLTHRNMVSNVLQAVAWARPFIRGEGDIVVTPLPLYHIFSLTANLLAFVEFGGCNLLITDPRDIRGFVKSLARARFTYLTGVNTLFNALLRAPEFREVDFSALKVCMGGGMAVQKAVADAWQQATGCVLAQGYGLTEASPIVCASPLNQKTFTGSIGLPIPSTRVRIVDEDGRPQPVGEIGEICVSGPQVMAGYWNRPEETQHVFDAEGWLRTGDMGYMDPQGFVYIGDRKKDMIVVSGFKVYPNEVEDVIAHHAGVREAVAVGIPDARSGEAVKLFVVREDPSLTAEEVIAYCRERLTAYKVPHVVEFRDDLPKTNVGKVLRRALRDDAPAGPPAA
jgi:long-chain acyl-CoA synthetase